MGPVYVSLRLARSESESGSGSGIHFPLRIEYQTSTIEYPTSNIPRGRPVWSTSLSTSPRPASRPTLSLQGEGEKSGAQRLSDIEYPPSNIQHPRSNIQHQTSNIEHQISNIKYRASTLRHFGKLSVNRLRAI